MHRIKRVKNYHRYSADFQRKVALEYLSGRFSYAVAAEEYGLKNKDVVKEFVRWYHRNNSSCLANDSTESIDMAKTKDEAPDLSAEALQRKVKELEGALALSKLKVEALETMIDIAEDQLKLDIRKKSGTQRLKR